MVLEGEVVEGASEDFSMEEQKQRKGEGRGDGGQKKKHWSEGWGRRGPQIHRHMRSSQMRRKRRGQWERKRLQLYPHRRGGDGLG